MNVAVAALSRMVSCAPAMVREAQAVTKGQMSVLTFGGHDRDGENLRHAFCSIPWPGAAAPRSITTGSTARGTTTCRARRSPMSRPMRPAGPILYLFRSFVPDTAGPGRTRGGATTGLGFAAL